MRRAALLLGLLAPLAALAGAGIPTVEGLAVTTAVAEPAGDYESVKRLQQLEDGVWRIAYNASLPGAKGGSETVQSERLQAPADLDTATQYRTAFESDVEEDYPGTTALGVSRAVHAALAGGKPAAFTLVVDPRQLRPTDAAASVLDLAKLFGAGPLNFRGELKPAGKQTFRTLVNGVDTPLPALVAQGSFKANTGETVAAKLVLLDDPAQPLALEWQMGDSRLRVVRVEWPRPAPSQVGTLRTQKRLTLPGLYFDFGSARLRPESAPAIAELRALLRATPELKLALHGHTDGVGAAAANQKLSEARAAAVKAALAESDPALAARLGTAGYGASRPVADNGTLEGRAANRRVELVVLSSD